MGKRILFFMVLLVLVFALSGISYGWQGRMGGMGDPFGLVADESDYLIHPAKITKGEGVRFYGDYRFTYTDVMDWDYDIDWFWLNGTLGWYYHLDTTGQEYYHDALLGTAFPLGPGRMGLFFSYSGKRGDYDGDQDNLGIYDYEYDLMSDLDDFAMRFLYGLQVMGLDVGLELGVSYRNEKQEGWRISTNLSSGSQNNPHELPVGGSLFVFMIPYDSRYWEMQWKTGIEKRFDSWTIDVSLRGCHIISSDNTYEYVNEQPVGTLFYYVDMVGDVAGWQLGSDIWLRYDAGNGLTLPLLFSVDYAEKKRDGDGITNVYAAYYAYEHDGDALAIKVGGGIEKDLGNHALVGVGLYYAYLRKRDALEFYYRYSWGGEGDYESDKYPLHQEHSAILRGIFEKELSPLVALRMGLDFFYGWAEEEFKNNRITNVAGSLPQTDVSSLDGPRWGIEGSIGGSITFKHFTFEPFFAVGYQEIDLSGDGERIIDGTTTLLTIIDKKRREWYISTGFSMLYDL